MLDGTIEPIDLDIQLLLNESFAPAARSAAIASFARETLGDAEAQNKQALGFVPDHTTTVDGTLGAREDAVRPDGTIVYTFALLDELFAWIFDQLEAHSPVGRDAHAGLYQSSHVLFADGAQIMPGDPVPPASKYVFFNTQPYSRQIEGGESSQAPSGVYEAVAVLAQQRFGNQAKIAFGFISPEEGGIVDWAKTPLAASLARRKRGGRVELHQDWLTRVPSITITTS
jgi:hypothetical protein